MIKVTALTAHRTDPPSRLRFRQYIEPLARLGVEVRERYLPITRYRRQPLAALATLLRVPGVAASRRSDITWLRRELIPERFTLERFTGGRRIFDVDDAVWLSSDSGFSERIVEICDGVIAGNRWLAAHYAPLGKPVWIVPTAIDTEKWTPAPRPPDGEWIVGWMGIHSNLRYLRMVEEPLAEFLTQHKGARLRVVCDRRPSFRLIPPELCEYIKWSPENEIQATREMDAGLMPLDDSEWTRGKCAAKMLAYLAVGVPAVVSPVGVNEDILALGALGLGAVSGDEWFHALKKLYDNRERSREMGRTGREIVEEHYSVRSNAPKLAAIFSEVVNKQ